MAFYADYRIILDSKVTLELSNKSLWQKSINLSTKAAINQSCILQWYYVGQSGTDLSYRFSVNEKTIRTHRIVGNVYGTAHEIFKGELEHGKNGIRVQLVPGAQGIVKISDVVLWFQRDAGGGPD